MTPSARLSAKVVLIFLIGCGVASFLYFQSEFSLPSLQARAHELPLALVVSLYALGSVTFVVCCLPGANMVMMLGGALFGLWQGVLLCALSLSVGAVISMLLARFVLREFVLRRFGRHVALVEKHAGAESLIAMRLIPVIPYFLTNLVFGLTPISIFKFWSISLLASLPAVFLYANAGAELIKGDLLSWRLFASLGTLACLPFAGRWLSRRTLHARAEKLED